MAKGSGRRSDADRRAARLVVRVEPTRKLNTAEKKTWDRVVGSVSPDHFTTGDAVLLEQYCAAVDSFEKARKKGDQKSMEAMGRLTLSYATRLRLSPQTRYDARAAARNAERGRANAVDDRLIGGTWSRPN